MRDQRGFSLLELVILFGIIAVLAVAICVALKPVQHYAAARDAKRWSDAENILDAIKLNQADNGGSYPANISSMSAGKAYEIGTAPSGCDTGCAAKSTAAACLDLGELVSGGYLSALPMDPNLGSSARTGYYAIRNASGSLEIGACNPESGITISVFR